MAKHFVQIGVLGQIGRFSSVDCSLFQRGTEVVCRTRRGLETGIVLSAENIPAIALADRPNAPADSLLPANRAGDEISGDSDDGKIIRMITSEDKLLVRRLQRNRLRAIDACTNLLKEKQLTSILLDVEHLFDGQSLYFYFLGEVDPALEKLTGELAETYEAKVRFRKFSETLVNGCGPDCGTKDCSTGGCATCASGGGCAAKALQTRTGAVS